MAYKHDKYLQTAITSTIIVAIVVTHIVINIYKNHASSRIPMSFAVEISLNSKHETLIRANGALKICQSH